MVSGQDRQTFKGKVIERLTRHNQLERISIPPPSTLQSTHRAASVRALPTPECNAVAHSAACEVPLRMAETRVPHTSCIVGGVLADEIASTAPQVAPVQRTRRLAKVLQVGQYAAPPRVIQVASSCTIHQFS